MADEGRETTPPGPEEFLKGSVAGRPGIAAPIQETKKKPERTVRLGPTAPTKEPLKKGGWWQTNKE